MYKCRVIGIERFDDHYQFLPIVVVIPEKSRALAKWTAALTVDGFWTDDTDVVWLGEVKENEAT